jgi:ribosome-dependent ATPase
MSDTPVAHIEGVSHRYGATIALDNVTIDIPSRIMVGVIGPDGVGKSTLLALISGVRAIQSGKVFVFDNNLAARGHLRNIRGRIAYMPQGLGRNLLSHAQRVREYRLFRSVVRTVILRAACPHH